MFEKISDTFGEKTHLKLEMAKIEEKLRAYFLGELSEEESLRMENEFLGNEEKFAELQSAENDLLDDYASKRLSPNQKRAFEENYLNSPFRQNRLEFAQTFSNHLQNEIKPIETIENTRFAWIDIFSFWKIGVAFASLIMILFGVFWLFKNPQPTPKDELVLTNNPTPKLPQNTVSSPQSLPQVSPTIEKTPIKIEPKPSVSQTPISIPKPSVSPTPNVEKTPNEPKPNEVKQNQTAFLALSVVGLRDGGKNAELNLKKETKNVVLRLNLGQTNAKIFQVKIQNADGETIFQTKNSRANGKNINLNLPAKLLKNDDYSVEISTTNTNGESEKVVNYTFRVKNE